MKILIISEFYFPLRIGGAEVSTQLLAETLVALGVEVHICTSSKQNYDEIINGVHIHRRVQHNFYWSYEKDEQPRWKKICWHLKEMYNICNGAMISKLIDEIKPDILHSNVFTGFSVSIWEIAWKKKIPIVHTLRDYYLMCVRCALFNNGSRCIKHCSLCKYTSVLKKMMSQKVDCVVGISQYILQRHLEKGYFNGSSKKIVIPNSVPAKPVNQVIKRKKVIGYLGRIHASKGIELLIKSFLKLGLTDYTLEIAGDGDADYISFIKKTYQNDKIRFIGRTDAYTFLTQISLLVVPSLWDEPFGRIIIEAQVCGCPVIASNRGGIPELINENIGRIFEIEKENSLYELLKQFINNQLSFEILPTAVSLKYSNETIATQYLSLYNRLLCK